MNARLRRLGTALALTMAATAATAAGDIIDNDANAAMLANQAKGLVQHTTRDGPQEQNSRLRAARGSQITPSHQETECGGVAIGNVRPAAQQHGRHETTVIIRGNVINSGNRC